MDEDHRLALKLAHLAEERDGAEPASVVARAKVYLDFLLGTHDAKTDQVSSDAEHRGF